MNRLTSKRRCQLSLAGLLGAVLLWLPASIVAAETRTFSLAGMPIVLEDATPQVAVFYRAMRFNRALNVWNAELVVSNKSAQTLRSPFILHVTNAVNTPGPVDADGTQGSRPFYDLGPFVAGGDLAPGGVSLPRTIAFGIGPGAPVLSTAFFTRTAAGGAALGLTRSMDEVGQPLPDVEIQETGPGGLKTFRSDPHFGLATVGGANGLHIWRFTRSNSLPVWRQLTLSSNTVSLVPNPRLTARNTNRVSVSSAGGEIVARDVRVTVPAGAFGQSSDFVLTPLTSQTLPALLPQGWSPLQAFWLELNNEPAQPLAVSAPLWDNVSSNETIAWARLDTNNLTWRVVQLVSGNGTNGVTGLISGSGAYAALVPDAGPGAPPSPIVGQPLQAGSLSPASVASFTASGTVEPSTSPASRFAELVTANATVVFSNALPFPSGGVLRTEVTESYQMQDGARRITPSYEAFISAYQRPGDGRAETAQGRFPMRPLLLLGGDELIEARVRLDVLADSRFSGSVIETNGAELATEGIRLIAGAGTFAQREAAYLRRLSATQLVSLNISSNEVVLGFELGIAETLPGKRLALILANQNSNALFVLARVVRKSGIYGYEPVERFTSDATGKVTSLEPTSGERLPGITSAGTYVLLRVGKPQGLVQGVTRGTSGAPQSDLIVRLNPWTTFSATGGLFRLLAPTGTVNVALADLASGNEAQQSTTVVDANQPTALDLSARPTGPRVLSVTPAANAIAVSRVTPIVVTFSEPVNPGTVAGSGLQLLGTNGQPVVASVNLNLRNTILTLLPASPLAANSLFAIHVSTNVADTSGLPLEGPHSFSFKTASDAIARTGARLIIYEPTNGLAALFGTPGSADPEAPVILVNETIGSTATILSRPDGSFTNFIAAGVDDFISAVTVNQNGTRTTLPASRQIFRDGRVGLFNGGGVVEAQGEGGPFQLLIEPGAVKTKTIFKITPVPLAEMLASLPNPPEDAQVIAGFRYGMNGDQFAGGSDVSVPIDPARISLPDGAPPEEGAYALALVRDLEGGGVAYQIVDKLKYENGRLKSNTQPFQGIGDAFTDAIANNPLGVLGMTLNPTEAIIQAAVTILVLGVRPVTVTGRVGLCPAFASGGCIDEALDPFLQGFEQFAPPLLEGVAEELVQATRRPLQGAFVSLSRPNQPSALRGRLQSGIAYTTSGRDGVYALVLPFANGGYVLRATHPRFAEKQAVALRPTVDYQLGQGAVKKNFTFEVPVPADSAPRVDVAHSPLLPATNQQAVVTIDAIHPTTPTILVSIESVEGGISADVVLIQGAISSPAPNQTRKEVRVSSAKAVTPKLKISVVTTNDSGGTVTMFHHVTIGLTPPAVTNLAIQSDDFDKAPPQLERTEPLLNGLLAFGKPLVLFFNEPIDRAILNQASQFALNSAGIGTPTLRLNDDQTRLEIQFVGLKSGADYELSVSAVIKDIAGNEFIAPPTASAGTSYKLKFRTLPVASGALSAVGSGGGIAVHNNIAYVLDRGAQQRLLVYNISNPRTPELLSSSFQFIATPRDLAVIPKWAHVRRRGQPAITNDMLAVVIGDLGSQNVDKDGNVFFEGQLLRIIDVSNPANPTLVQGARLSLRPNAITKIRWDPPMLSFFEIGSDLQQIGLIDLQEMFIGLTSTPAEVDAFPLFGIRGKDDDQNGDYVGPNDRLPTPPKEPIEFFGRGRSFLPPGNNGTRIWTDYSFQFRGDYAGVVFRGGFTVDQLGNPTTTALKPGYRTLALGGDIAAPTATVEFGANANPKRVFTLLSLNIGTVEIPDLRHVALVSLAPDHDGESKLAVIDITQPNAPVLTNKIVLPPSLNLGLPQSVIRRDNGILALAMTRDLVLLDQKRLFFQASNGVAHPAILQIVPGAGSGNITLGGNNAGVNAVALGARNELVQTAPELAFARVLRGSMTDPSQLAGNVALRTEVLEALRITAALSPARLRGIGGAVSTLEPANATNHYHVLMRAPGGAGTTVKLGVHSLNRSGYPLRNKGRGFAAVRAVSAMAGTQLGQTPRTGCDAPADALVAHRLSSDIHDPLYNVYLSKPFALVYEKISIDEVNTLRSNPARELVWSDFYLEAFIDVEMQSNPVLGPFAARVSGAAEGMDRILLPRASAVAESFPGTYIMGPNPPPVSGGEKVPGTFGTVSANNGEFRHDTIDISLPGRRMPIIFQRAVGGQDLWEGAFGRGWDFNYGQRLTPLRPEVIGRDHRMPQLMRALSTDSVVAEAGDLLWLNGAGRIILFTNCGPAAPSAVASDPLFTELGWSGRVRTYYLPAQQNGGVFDPVFEFQDGQFARLTRKGEQFWYDRAGRLQKIYHRYTKNFQKLTYNARGELVKIVDGSIADDKRYVELGYYRLAGDSERRTGLDEVTPSTFVAGKIARLKDYTGRIIDYEYTPDGILKTRFGLEGSSANNGLGGRVEVSYVLPEGCSPTIQGVAAGGDPSQANSALFTLATDSEGSITGPGTGAGGTVAIIPPANNTAANAEGSQTKSMGPTGASVDHTFDKLGYPRQVKYSGPNNGAGTMQTTYNALGLLERIVYPLGNSVVYTYDINNASLRSRANLLKEERLAGPRGGSTLVSEMPTYDRRYNLPVGDHKDFNGKTMTYVVTSDGRDIDTITYQNAGKLDYDYNDYGQLERERTPEGLEIDPTYDATTGFKASENRGPVPFTFSYNSTRAAQLGLPTTISLPYGAQLFLTYDDRLLLIEKRRGSFFDKRGYDRNGKLRYRERAVAANKKLIEDHTFNRIGFLEKLVVRSVEVDGAAQDLIYRFDATAADAFRVRTMHYPSGAKKEFTYDHLGNITSTKLGAYTEEYGRDLHGNLTSLTQKGILTRRYEYDGHDRMTNSIALTGGGNEMTTLGYFGEGGVAGVKVTDPDFGVLYEMAVEEIDGLGRARKSRITGSPGSSSDAIKEFFYTPVAGAGGSIRVGGPVDDRTTSYDAAGRVVGVQDTKADVILVPNGNGGIEEVRSSENGTPFITEFDYDTLDNRTEHRDGIGTAFSIQPRLDGAPEKITDGAGRTIDQTFTVLGERTTLTRQNNVGFSYEYDANRQVTRVGDKTQAGHEYTYDPATLRRTSKRLRSNNSFSFDSPNALNLPEGGTLPGGTLSMTYDLQGRLTSQTLTYAQGQPYKYSANVDALGRVRTTSYGPDAQRSAIFTHDKLGPLVSARYTENLGTFEVTATLNADATRATVTYPSGGITLTENRDNGGRILSVAMPGETLYRITGYHGSAEPATVTLGGGVITEALRYDARKRILARRYESAGGALLADVRYSYDRADNRIARQEVHRHGRTDRYEYDNGNRLTRSDVGLRPSIVGAVRVNAGALTSDFGLAKGLFARIYVYDGNGFDLLMDTTTLNPDAIVLPPLPPFARSMTAHDASLLATIVDGTNRPPTDPLGNAGGTILFVRTTGALEPQPVPAKLTYSALSQLVNVDYTNDGNHVVIDYEHQPDGLVHYRKVTRNGTVESETALVYDRKRLIEEHARIDGTNQLRARYFYADEDSPFAADLRDASGDLKRYFYLRDAQSSVVAVAGTNGNILERITYDAWGQPVIEARDTNGPRVSAIFASVNNEMLVQFTETVLPPLTGAGAGGGIVIGTAGLQNAFELTGASGPISLGASVYEENLQVGFPFGALVRIRPQGNVSPNLSLRVPAGSFIDEWGNPNVEQIIPFTRGTNIVLHGGPPFGSTAPRRIARSELGSPFLFHGQYFDYDTGLLYLRARFYDPFTGTFLQQDPFGYEDSVNLYAGFRHNPASLRDPNGTAPPKKRKTPEASTGSGNITSTTKPDRKRPRLKDEGTSVIVDMGGGVTINSNGRVQHLPDKKVDDITDPFSPMKTDVTAAPPMHPTSAGQASGSVPAGTPQQPTAPSAANPFHGLEPLIQTPDYAIYVNKNGEPRIRFRAAAANTVDFVQEGRNHSPDAHATLNPNGTVFVQEGRHRAIGASQGDVIPEHRGGVPGHPGWLDYKLSDDGPTDEVGVPAKSLHIDRHVAESLTDQEGDYINRVDELIEDAIFEAKQKGTK